MVAQCVRKGLLGRTLALTLLALCLLRFTSVLLSASIDTSLSTARGERLRTAVRTAVYDRLPAFSGHVTEDVGGGVAGDTVNARVSVSTAGVPVKFTAQSPSHSGEFPHFSDWNLGTTYIYSAHYDDRYGEVAMVADTARPVKTFWCNLTSNAEGVHTSWNQSCKVRSLNARKRFNILIICPVSALDGRRPIPSAVTVYHSQQGLEGAHLPVLYSQTSDQGGVKGQGLEVKFGVCTPAFTRNFAKVNELVEFIEGNRLFGAQHFTFYNYSASPVLYPVLRSYVEDGLVTVVQWPLYEGAADDLVYYGQSASMYDCMYRNLNKAVYLAFLDLDEIIVPRDENWSSWSDILDGGTNARTSSMGSPCNSTDCVGETAPGTPPYSHARETEKAASRQEGAWDFQCVFYKKEWPDAGPFVKDDLVNALRVNSLLKTVREKKIWPHQSRSKFIVATRRIRGLGVHQPTVLSSSQPRQAEDGPSRFVPIINVAKEKALLHHYRDWEDTNVSPKIVATFGTPDDFLARRHGHQLLRAIVARYKRANIGIGLDSRRQEAFSWPSLQKMLNISLF